MSGQREDVAHPLVVRVIHWINAFALIALMLSGWRIYNASPLFDFEFPSAFTLGGWLGGALAWHFAAMWLLVANALVSVVYALLSGHIRRRFLPVSFVEAARELAAPGRLHFTAHEAGRYTAVQRIVYLAVFVAVIAAVLSGAAIWKPVQWQALTALFGGYEGARLAHFFAMATIALFLAVHITLALTVQGVLVAMITGRRA